MNKDLPENVLFFDGVCGLCNRTVDFLLRRDRNQRILFAPLQGETARRELSPQDVSNLNTIVLKTPQRLYKRSAAVVRLLWLLGGGWSFCGTLLWLIPWPLRDLGYWFVASSRYSLFGKKETCRIPTAEERSRFLP
ncbi:MAG TPA: DCC1-like thiol-disulfide oxidoreductase family protein [Planctomycetaceae bacterium]|nr:DCC1-like thiol-disulfide oxidoreductase family protein [Planctomycetaceae bacterium]